jgi:hypothetical protein
VALITGKHLSTNSNLILRHMGRVRMYCKRSEVLISILHEMIARLLKDIIRKEQRLMMRKKGFPAEQPYVKIVLHHLNKFFFDPDHQNFWNGELKVLLQLKYSPECLLTEEKALEFDLYKTVTPEKVFSTLIKLVGLRC